MRYRWHRFGVTAAATLIICFLIIASGNGQPLPKPKTQVGQGAQDKPQMAETVFKNIQLLRGISVDEFMDTMGFFAASTGLNCTNCHGLASADDWSKYADDPPLKQTARRMILMVNALNKTNFAGTPTVTCYTCHRGDTSPKGTPSLAVQYGTPPPDDPNEFEIGDQPSGASADQIFDKYIQALGGRERLDRLTTFVAKGTYNGYDTEFEDVAIEIFAKVPDQRSTIIHFRSGDSMTTFDGHAGWIVERDKPVPVIELTGGDLDGAKVDASIFFSAGIKEIRSGWRAGSTTIDDRQVQIVEGNSPGKSPVKLYFDKESALLVREVRYTQLPIGRIPAQIDYSDYREVSGIKIPFRWTTTWTDGRSTTVLKEIQPNAAIDPAKFEKPDPSTPQNALAH